MKAPGRASRDNQGGAAKRVSSRPPLATPRAYVFAGALALAWWGVWTAVLTSGNGAAIDSLGMRVMLLGVPIAVIVGWLLVARVRRRLRIGSAPDYVPDLALIDALNKGANRGEDRNQLLVRLADGTRAAFSSNGANVYLLDEAREYLVLLNDPRVHLLGARITLRDGFDGARIRLAESSWYAAALHATQPVVTDSFDEIVAMAAEFEGAKEYEQIIPTLLRTKGISSVMTVPILSANGVSGVVDMSRGWQFTEQEVTRFRVICDEVALVLGRIDMQERLSKSENLYRALAELTPDLIFVVDGTQRVVLANMAAARFVGRSLEELKGVPITDLFGPMGAQFETHLSQVALTGKSVEAEDRLTVVKSEVWLKTSLVPLADVAPGLVLGVSRDISDSKRLEAALRTHAEEVERLATHDALTGLANRRAFMVALDRAVALAQRGTTSAVLFTDVDCFKRCNDERGHTFGDEVLTSVADRLGKEAREVDLVARIGGDEFAALLTGTDEAGGLIVAKRMRESILALAAEIGIPIDLSVGVAEVTPDTNAVHIVAMADQRMYERKAAHQDTRVVEAEAGQFSDL